MINASTNYSFLFSSLGSSFGTSNSSSVSTSSFLSDYASIKNGSYGKLMKAYYGKTGAADTLVSQKNSTNSTSADDTKTLARVQSATDDLKDAADALLSKTKDSLFKEKDITTTDENGVTSTKKGYDVDSIYKGVSAFVDAYNSVVDAAGNADSTSILNRTLSLQHFTKANAKTLSRIGITIGKDNKLSIDEKAFKESNMTTVKSLFHGNGSFGYQMSAKASLINYTATKEAAKANTYNMNASYNNPFSSGSIYNSYF